MLIITLVKISSDTRTNTQKAQRGNGDANELFAESRLYYSFRTDRPFH